MLLQSRPGIHLDNVHSLLFIPLLFIICIVPHKIILFKRINYLQFQSHVLYQQSKPLSLSFAFQYYSLYPHFKHSFYPHELLRLFKSAFIKVTVYHHILTYILFYITMIQGVHRRTKRQVKNPHAGPSAIRLRGLLSFLFPILSHSVPCGKTWDNALILLGVDWECSRSWLGGKRGCERNGVERAPMRSLDFLCAFLDFFVCLRI